MTIQPLSSAALVTDTASNIAVARMVYLYNADAAGVVVTVKSGSTTVGTFYSPPKVGIKVKKAGADTLEVATADAAKVYATKTGFTN
tara:strand:+ start:71 stop:331 length:261 start_codon:yes stop_codon:yes gene_type:complete